MKRMWVNQPSKAQPLHKLHGTNVLAEDNEKRIYFLSGDVISQEVPRNVLSEGWIEDDSYLNIYSPYLRQLR